MTTRRANDFYPTPTWATEHLLSVLPFELSGSCGEPTSGDRAIANLLIERGLSCWTNDIDPSHPADFHLNACFRDSWDQLPRADWIIGNPPFNVAPDILPHALEHAQKGLIMLLRLSYLEACGNRGGWLAEHSDLMSVVFLPRRVSFTGDGNTDNVATSWFLWGKHSRLCDAFIYPEVEVKQLALI